MEMQVKPTSSFLEYLRSERNRSEHTIYNYGVALKEFESFFSSLGEGLDWDTLDSGVVREWIIFMIEKEKKQTATVNLSLSALRSFYRYMLSTGRVHKNPMLKVSGPKKRKRLPSFLKESELDTLLDKCERGDGFVNLRDHLIISLLYSTGMRRAEVLGLQDSDIRLSELTIKVTGKRNKQRLIPISSDLGKEIEEYQQARDSEFPDGSHGTKFLLGNKGKDLRPDEIHKIVHDQLGTVTNQEKRSPHVLRHTFATSMLNHGASLESIQKLLGHESLETTQIYTHLSFEELKKEYNNAHPRH